jgi:uncharacterized protein with von Willebrand factor type A (vWA) domain
METKRSELPFFDLFSRVRAAGIMLAKEDYFDLLHALKAQFGMDLNNPDDVRAQEQQFIRLAKFIWTRSAGEEALFEQAWTESKQFILRQIALQAGEGANEIATAQDVLNAQNNAPKPLPVEPLKPETPNTNLNALDDELENEEREIPLPVIDPDKETPPYKPLKRWFKLDPDCYDLTLRQMYQSWRKLDRPTKTGLTDIIDLPQTIQDIARTGMFLQAAYLPELKNTTKLLILADSQGSMLPFHGLSEQIILAAKKEGGLQSVAHYFFLNYPEKNLYTNAAQTEFIAQKKAFETSLIGQNPAILIISDAGAARGQFNPTRVAATNLFINYLQQHSSRRIVWLNPMPRTRWKGTSAQYIAKNVAMFEASAEGFRAAIDKLK